MKKIIILLLLAGLGFGGYQLYLKRMQPEQDNGRLALYGNVDIRTVDLAFKDVERIQDMHVQEGDQVARGEVLAVLETARLRESIAASRAAVEAQEFVVQRLRNGSRPEELQAARAQVEQAKAELLLAERTLERKARLIASGSTTQQEVDDAKATRDVAQAKLRAVQEEFNLVKAGPRWEEVSEAQASLQAQKAQLAGLEVQLEESSLRAPVNAVVRNRNLEPGDMASTQKPVYTLAVMDPKWVRTYVPESKLGLLTPGMTGYVVTDSHPGKQYTGAVGFISSVAEFTPRSVETPELRTSLVYEVRFNVQDPDNDLRLGMPATVVLDVEDVSPAAFDGGSASSPVSER